jgi:hypothetical protein
VRSSVDVCTKQWETLLTSSGNERLDCAVVLWEWGASPRGAPCNADGNGEKDTMHV